MNINANILLVLGAKLHETAKYFHCGTEFWEKIINSKQYIQIQRIVFALNV